jgi:malate/lactate dehydrogenase
MTRVGIIGTGWVGSSVAISTLHAGLAQDLLLYDVRTAIVEGGARDLVPVRRCSDRPAGGRSANTMA